MSKFDDQYYILKILNGQVNAYRFLVEKHKNTVYSIVLRIVQNDEDAEEIAQDVFLKAFNSINTFKGDSKFSTWLYRIAYNTSISKTRKKKLPVSSIDDFELSDFDYNQVYEDYNDIELLEKKKYLKIAIKKLPNDEAMVITLYYIDELSVDEISDIVSISKSNVKIRLFRARKKMFNYLHKMFVQELI